MTETPDAQLSADADAAADQLEQHGWMQGQVWGIRFDGMVARGYEGGPTCAVGAVRVALGLTGYTPFPSDDQRFCALIDAVEDHVIDCTGDYPTLAHWNDAKERTAQEVVDSFRDVATKYRPDEYRSGGVE